MMLYASKDADALGWDPLPYIIHKVILDLLNGNTINEWIIEEGYPLDIPYWWDNLGNISEEVVYTQWQAVFAIYDLYHVISGCTPYNFEYSQMTLNQNLTDYEIEDQHHNFDLTYHTYQAIAYEDPNSPGWGSVPTKPLKFLPQKALQFWNWWLFEALPLADKFDGRKADWDIFAKDKYVDLFIPLDAK